MKEELIKQLEKNFYEGLDRIKPHIVGHITATNLIVNSFQEAIKALSQSEWVSVEDRLPENGQFVLCLGEHQEDNDFVNETLDLYNEKKLDKKEMDNWFNPILSVQFRIIENQNCWLYPNVLDGGLVDFSDSITHWMPLPQPPKTK